MGDKEKENDQIIENRRSICAVICGADGWVDIATVGEARHDWFKKFLELPNGIPSHDTFGRVLAALDPAQFKNRFLSSIQVNPNHSPTARWFLLTARP